MFPLLAVSLLSTLLLVTPRAASARPDPAPVPAAWTDAPAPAAAPALAPVPGLGHAPAPASTPGSHPGSSAALDDDGRSVDVAILDVLLERGIIDAATYDELLAVAAAEKQRVHDLDLMEARLQRLAEGGGPKVTGGKPGKLQFESEDGKWTLGIRGRAQINAEMVDGENGNDAASETNFSVRRARIAFAGKAGGERTTYKVEFEAPTQNRTDTGPKDFALTDAYVNWGLGASETYAQAGQYFFPFGREVNLGAFNRNLVNESIASVEFTPNREPGVMLYGSSTEKLVEWWAGTSNGEGTGNSNADGQDGTGSDGLRTGGRLVFNPFGPLERDSSSFQTVGDGSVKWSFGGSWMVNADKGQDLDGDGVQETNSHDTTIGLETQLFAGPISFLAETYDRSSDISGGADVDDSGYTAQLGVFLVPSRFEVVVRRSDIDFDVRDDTTEDTLGLNYYLDKNNSKFALDVSTLENHDTANRDSTRYRAQYQIVF